MTGESYRDRPMDPELAGHLAAIAVRRIEREQARCDYLSEVIENHLPDLRAALVTADMTVEQEAAALFSGTEQLMHDLDFQVVNGVTLPTTPGSEAAKRHQPLFSLGWARPFPMASSKRDYVLWPTVHGFELLDGLRAAIGDPSTAQARQQNIATRRRLIAQLRDTLLRPDDA